MARGYGNYQYETSPRKLQPEYIPNKQKNSKEIPYYVYIANVGYEYANGLIHNIEKEKIVENIKSKSGSKYDPEIITIFLNIIGEI